MAMVQMTTSPGFISLTLLRDKAGRLSEEAAGYTATDARHAHICCTISVGSLSDRADSTATNPDLQDPTDPPARPAPPAAPDQQRKDEPR
ncbi:hypothetical protein [Streptomyces fungicidicus]|uniref:hypothetical protein n=1 Tax=Streptomyces fungicidicus TaxID=68203 RepID=UPI003D727FB2